MSALYDTIGLNYADLRQPDVRISRRIEDAIAGSRSVLNVGAGTGSYEPANSQVTAVEPSREMIQQRPVSSASVVQARAENLPFDDNSFDASMAVLTIHHWSGKEAGVRELRRVTRGKIVFLTYDPGFRGFWLADYFPALVTLDEEQMPQLENFEKWLGSVKIEPVTIHHDCTDGFLAGYWRRPSAYLDERVRMAISSFWSLGDVSDGLRKLEEELESGAWAQRYSHLLNLEELDCGYRLITAG